MQIECASTKDIPELLDLLYTMFVAGNPEHPRFEVLYPNLFVETETAAQRHLIIRKNERIVSCVGTYPMTLTIAGCHLPEEQPDRGLLRINRRHSPDCAFCRLTAW